MTSRALLLISALFLLPLSQANAQPVPPQATAAYEAGDYADAARIAGDVNSAPALAYAARALIADAITRPDGFCTDCLRQAEALARRASRLDPRNVEACLQEAIAMGFRGRSIGVSAARAEGLAEKVRERLDATRAIDPRNPWAKAALGAWHLEIVTHAGSVLASLLYGASQDEGLALYREALGERPGEAPLQYQFALALLALDRDTLVPEARQALMDVRGSGSKDALTIFTKGRAATLLEALDAPSRGRLRSLVLQFQGYPSDR